MGGVGIMEAAIHFLLYMAVMGISLLIAMVVIDTMKEDEDEENTFF